MTIESGTLPSPVPDGKHQKPRVFISYASENKELAEQVANAISKNGIETWWDEWEIRSGDSIRQKVDEGIEDCTHFIVLLTPQSIDKPWVKLEMDAAFFSKLEGKCRFIAVRHQLEVDRLPPTLRGLLSPEIKSGTDIDGLISDIYGVNKKPTPGTPPAAVLQAQEVKTGYSPAVSAVAKLFVERSQSALKFDPQLDVDEIVGATKLTVNDVLDAVDELEEDGFVERTKELVPPEEATIIPCEQLFVVFDRFWKPWNSNKDAQQIAVDMTNNEKFPTSPSAIADHYGFEMRQLIPALYWLRDRGLVRISDGMGTGIGFHVEPNRSALRRFVREIS